MSVMHQHFIVWGLCVECWRQEILHTLITKLDLQYPVFEKRWSLNRCNCRRGFFATGYLETHTSGGQIADPGVPLWSIMLVLLHRVPARLERGISFNRNVTILVHVHNEQSLASTKYCFPFSDDSIMNSVFWY